VSDPATKNGRFLRAWPGHLAGDANGQQDHGSSEGWQPHASSSGSRQHVGAACSSRDDRVGLGLIGQGCADLDGRLFSRCVKDG
jgi:hypothetical protein